MLGGDREKNVLGKSLIGPTIPAVLMGERSKQETVPLLALNSERTEHVREPNKELQMIKRDVLLNALVFNE